MWKGVKGREAILDFFRQEIPRRRAGQATDLFSELCRATKMTDRCSRIRRSAIT